MHKTKGLFLVWPLGGFILASQPGLIEFGLSILVIHFCLERLVVGTLIYLGLTLISLESLCKNKPPNIRMIFEAKNK